MQCNTMQCKEIALVLVHAPPFRSAGHPAAQPQPPSHTLVRWHTGLFKAGEAGALGR